MVLDLFPVQKNVTLSESKALTYSPTSSISSVSTYAPTVSYAPSTVITYPQYALQIGSPFGDISQQNTARQQPQIAQYPSIPSSLQTNQEPSTKVSPSSSTSASAGIDPMWLIIGGVAVVALLLLVKK